MAQRPNAAVVHQQRLPSFQHERLKQNANSIRLVQIQSSAVKGASISLRITQYAKQRRPKYVAISYTWGSNHNVRTIHINGKPFFVHTNLFNLLLHLRQRGEYRHLWVDALCIDQANLAERNFHVQLMAQIYDEAASTIVWLGSPSDDRREARAIDFVVEMANFLQKTKRGALEGFTKLYLNDIAAPRWANLTSFCCRSNYFTRCWVIQEFIQARQIEMVCGLAELDWTRFASVFSAIRDSCQSPQGCHLSELHNSLQRILSSVPGRLTSRRLSGRASPLQELIHEFYDAQCSEPRDKIYGMLGIASDCGERDDATYFGPQPDYSKHILEVYFDVLAHLRDTSNTFSVSLLTTLLLQKSLQISKLDVLEYLSQFENTELTTKLQQTTFHLRPSYMNIITDTIPNWTSIRDLKQRLDDFDWSQYVGYTMQPRRPTTPRGGTSSPKLPLSSPVRSSSAASTPMQRVLSSSSITRTLNALPKDIFTNALAVAEVHPGISTLYNYHPQASAFHLPVSILSAHHEDKRQLLAAPASSPTIPKPTLILENSPLAQPLRLGFAPPGTRRGDIICQFEGTDLTLIARRPAYGGQSLQLVGRAVMVKHEGLLDTDVHPVCRAGLGSWGSGSLSGRDSPRFGGMESGQGVTGGEGVNEKVGEADMSNGVDGQFAQEVIETDGVSMFEILRGGEG